MRVSMCAIRHWFIKSKTYGSGSLGRQGRPGDRAHHRDQPLATPITSSKHYGRRGTAASGCVLRPTVTLTTTGSGATDQTGLTWRRLIGDERRQPGEGERGSTSSSTTARVRRLRRSRRRGARTTFGTSRCGYAGEHGGFKFAAGIGYGESHRHGLQTNTRLRHQGCGMAANDDSVCRQVRRLDAQLSIHRTKTGPVRHRRVRHETDDYREDRSALSRRHRCRSTRQTTSGRRRPASRRSSATSEPRQDDRLRRVRALRRGANQQRATVDCHRSSRNCNLFRQGAESTARVPRSTSGVRASTRTSIRPLAGPLPCLATGRRRDLGSATDRRADRCAASQRRADRHDHVAARVIEVLSGSDALSGR